LIGGYYQPSIDENVLNLKSTFTTTGHMKFLSIAITIFAFSNFTGAYAQKKNNFVMPELKEGRYRITLQNAILEIDPALGARVTSLKLDGTNFLTGPEINPKYWGSSFWLSPQKQWNDFSHQLDSMHYVAAIENKVLKLVSQKDPKTGLIFSKEVSGNKKTGFFTIKYNISNASAEVRKIAPWEVTRVNVNGLAFYPRGEGERWGTMAAMAEDIDGITWFKHEAYKIPTKHLKMFSDGKEGWVAQINYNIIFIKKFPDIALDKAAPGEAEIEVYTNIDRSYVEIEQQGTFETLAPGASLTWEVSWFIGKLPASIESVKGNPSLPAYVRKLIKASSF
jgi:Domain of unknown function (DUF4380)